MSPSPLDTFLLRRVSEADERRPAPPPPAAPANPKESKPPLPKR